MIIRKIYKSIERFVIQCPVTLLHMKLVMSELIAIWRKKKNYKNISWSPAQQKEMDEYWLNFYGRKISNRWHRLYEAMNGFYCKEYFPEMLYTTRLEPLLNPDEYCRCFTDKSLLEFLYENDKLNRYRVPKSYIVNCNGRFRSDELNLITEEEAILKISDIGDCLIKPTVESGSGVGVKVLYLHNGFDQRSGRSIKDILDGHGKDYIIQEKLVNSALFSRLYPNAINTIRLITYFVGSEIHHVPLTMRIGVGGAEVDNIHNGGLCIGVHENGKLKAEAYQLGYGDTAIIYEKHPDTGIVFDGYYIGDVSRIIEAGKLLHQRIPHIGIVSWDFTFDINDTVVLIEANCKDQSVWFPQIVNKCSCFGNDTPYMLSLLKNKK